LEKIIMMTMGQVFFTEFHSWQESITSLLDQAHVVDGIVKSGRKKVLIMPNLVEDLPPPITTPAACVQELVRYLQDRCDARIVIGAGCGSLQYDTHHCFSALGYDRLGKEQQVELIDLNTELCVALHNTACKRWPEMHLPQLLFDVFLISVPVLKAHTLAGVTLTMKNMMGAPPPAHYQKGGHWKKASFHANVHGAIFDLNRYRTPDFTLLDATVGMQEAHLFGPTCNPPKNKMACGFDPVAIDAWGADLLGFGWQTIDYICMADGLLGRAGYQEIRVTA
jgi:uncharacterized protein (DUF362 family)